MLGNPLSCRSTRIVDSRFVPSNCNPTSRHGMNLTSEHDSLAHDNSGLGDCLALFARPAFAEGQATEQDWTRFRGPNADGVAQDDPRLPDKWSKTENLKWVADVPGRGWSSPIVCGNKVFLTSVTSDGQDTAPKAGLYLGRGVKAPPKGIHHWLVRCLDLKTGQLLWQHEAHKGEPKVPRHPKSNYATETPTTDGERLYVLFGDVGLYAYDLGGKPLWSHVIEPKKTMMNYGAAASSRLEV